MVVSKLDKSISYPEIKYIMSGDKELSIEMYSIVVNKMTIIVAIGNEIDTYSSKKISYYPVYMIKNTGKAVQIGVYELWSSDVMLSTDENSQLDIETLSDPPLLYVFATMGFIQNHRMVPPSDESDSTNSLNSVDSITSDESPSSPSTPSIPSTPSSPSIPSIPRCRADIFSLDSSRKLSSVLTELTEETVDDAANERRLFSVGKTNSAPWIQKAMSNRNYHLVETDKSGDCFFDSIRLAFTSIGQMTTVAQLREKLSQEVTSELYNAYLVQYKMAAQTLRNEQKNAKTLSTEYAKYKDLVTNTISSTEQHKYIQHARSIARQHAEIMSSKNNANELYTEFKFMKTVKTMDDFVNMIQSKEYWADAWAVSTMERLLNVKFIILSSEHAKSDPNNMLQCGMNVDTVLETNGSFEPEYYLLLEYTGQHYRVITYKNKAILKYTEIPYDIKKLVVAKCMERNSGPFILIPQFRTMVETIETGAIGGSDVIDIDTLTSIDSEIIFQFYDKSIDKPAGKGVGEKMEPASRRLEFAKLSPKGEYANWRRKLANEWMHPDTPILLDNRKWNSAEHYIQAAKFKNTNPEFYKEFAQESGSNLSCSVESAVAAGSKNGTQDNIVLRDPSIKIDPEYHGRVEKKIILEAMTAKFSQIPHFKGLLAATKKATLNRYVPMDTPVIDSNLIAIRNTLTTSS